MARTFVRQDTQIRNSDVYDDSIAPSEAAFETNPTHIETDLNNLRSSVHNLLNVQAGNWWDDINTPTTLETGVQRGVNDLNTALHEVEKKRILRAVRLLSDVTVPAAVGASETLTLTGNAGNSQTVTIDGKTYTFQTSLTNVDGNVLIGASASDSLDNLIAAITLGAGAGTLYALATTVHPTYTAAAGAGDSMDIEAKIKGTQRNGDAVSETLANGSWGAATTSGGAGDVVVLGTGELPTQTTAAVGNVTTLGTVVAFETNFGTATTEEVTGSTALSPKNLCALYDGNTGDQFFTTDDRLIWGLMQSENSTDGHTITDTTPDRVQLSFVTANATLDDFELADGADMGGKILNYVYVERVRLEDLNEQDFLDSGAIDLPVGAGSTTRDQAYQNQGVTPVEVVTNAFLDLNSGTQWTIRDDVDANLFQVRDGSTGGNSTVQVFADTDVFDSDAVTNDFLNGISVDTGVIGTTINVGVTPNQIDVAGFLQIQSGGSANLELEAANELKFTDTYRAGSTWSDADGIPLARNSSNWSDFETAFGEVSILEGIIQAGTTSQHTKVQAVVTANVLANNDVSGPANDNNLDVNLGDLAPGNFVDDYDIYTNGQLQRNGANAAANEDVYPGTSLSDGQLRFEYNLKAGGNPDVITVIKWV